MCQKIVCGKCNKASWAGCGAHVEAVLRDVPKAERCTCERPVPKIATLLGKIFGSS